MEELIQYCLKLLCDPKDEERHFVTFEDNDSVVLVVNNYGGLSNLELGALTDETITQLGKNHKSSHRGGDVVNEAPASTWKIKPVRILTGAFETSLNAPGFSISLCNLSAASKDSNVPVTELLGLFDAPTTAVSWPNLTAPGLENAPASSQPDRVNESMKSSGGANTSILGKLTRDSKLKSMRAHIYQK